MSSTEKPREIELTRRSEHCEREEDSGVNIVRRPIRDWHAWSLPALIWFLVACIPGLIIGVASHFFSVVPLETKLLEVQARQTAGALDSVVRIRSAAVQIAASTRGSTNLVETEGLDRLLKALRGSFADFLSMEILDEHGEILAMVGELPLSQAARSVGKSKTAKVGTMSYRARDLFHDDPESDSFVLTVRHKGQEGKEWFTRTRFSREPIKQALASASEGTVATLMASPDGEANGTAKPATKWWSDGTATTVKLKTPGWMLQVKNRAHSTFPWGTAIAAGLVALVIGLGFVYRRLSPRDSQGWTGATQPECMRQSQTVRSTATQSSPCAKPEQSETAEPEDVWTPRNVPLGLEEPPEAEIVETCSPEDLKDMDLWFDQDEPGAGHAMSPFSEDEPVLDTEPESRLPESVGITADSAPAEIDEGMSSESAELASTDVPEFLDVVWLEPDDQDSLPIQSAEPDVAEAREELVLSCEDVAELLDVTWLEPDPGSPTGQQREADDKLPSKAGIAVQPVT